VSDTTNSEPELDARKAAILRTVVTGYVETAQPVGSSQVARESAVEVSPATIRADMAALERDGYLTHPHTSAGRIPTDKGYRFFVDHLEPLMPLLPAKQEQVHEFFSRAHGELERMLQDTSRLLSQLTDYAAVVVGPPSEKLVVRTALLTRLSSHTALLVVVMSNGIVEKRAVAVGEEVTDEDIEAASNYLHHHFSDRSLTQLGTSGPALPESGRQRIDALVDACRQVLDGSVESDTTTDQVFVGGAARMAERFEALDQVRAVLGILEHSFVVVSLLRDVIAQGQSVSIGSEHGELTSLAECSLVVAPFEGEGDSRGTIGILGPTRMDYPSALAAVAVVGHRLTRELQHG
jgi:heat-inducible transcriptional repressor